MKPLWPHWSSLRQRLLSAGSLLLFLDYDGTLVSITSHPARARLPRRIRSLLQALIRQEGISVVIVSGRCLRDIQQRVGVPGLCYVGNHGLELAGPKLRYVNPLARGSRPLLRRLAGALRRIIQPFPGAWVEDKIWTLSLHYRQVKPQDLDRLRNRVFEFLQPYQKQSRVVLKSGKKIWEVHPPVQWNKGTIVRWLLARAEALTGQRSVWAIYVGDDKTDEDAFRALRRRGLTVAVGSAASAAEYRVASCKEVEELLRRIRQTWKARTRR